MTITYNLRRLALLNDIGKTHEKGRFMAFYTTWGVIFGKPNIEVEEALRAVLQQAIASGEAPPGDFDEAELVITLEAAVIRPYVGGELQVDLLNLFSREVIGFTPCIKEF